MKKKNLMSYEGWSKVHKKFAKMYPKYTIDFLFPLFFSLFFDITQFWGHFGFFQYLLADKLKQIAGPPSMFLWLIILFHISVQFDMLLLPNVLSVKSMCNQINCKKERKYLTPILQAFLYKLLHNYGLLKQEVVPLSTLLFMGCRRNLIFFFFFFFWGGSIITKWVKICGTGPSFTSVQLNYSLV